MPKVDIPNHVLKKIKHQSSYPVEKLKKKKKVTEEEMKKNPTGDNIVSFLEVYKNKVLKEFEHPTKILAELTEKMININAYVEDEIVKSKDDGYLDIQMVEAYRRLNSEILKFVVEIKPDWDIAIEATIDETVLETIMDLETMFEFLGTKDPEMVEEFIEFRMKKLKEQTIPLQLNVSDEEEYIGV
jgi:predicted urease superfamily metal-dependent hydrolase